MKRFFSWQVIAIIVVALILALFDAPNSVQNTFGLPEVITNQKVNLGLDLQGGSQLDYKIDLRNVPKLDQEKIVEGVVGIINQRVNNLGVSEPNIYTSTVGDETHIIVELANTAILTDADVLQYLKESRSVDSLTPDEKKEISLRKAKDTVGKTIQLEFKEQKVGTDPQEKDRITSQATADLKSIKDKNGENFRIVGQEESLANAGKIKYEVNEYKFADEIKIDAIKKAVISLKPGEVYKDLVFAGGSYIINQTGETQEDTALVIVKLNDIREAVKADKQIEASHILIAYKDASNASADITRTKDEAYARAKEALAKLQAGKSFTDVAKFYSDDPSNKDLGGKLSKPIAEDNTYVYDFQKAGLTLDKDSQLSDIVETEFGYHIIKADKVLNNVKEKQYKYETISFSTVPDPWKDTGLTGKHFKHADVQIDKYYQPYISIEFDDDGAKLFEEITGRNVGKPVAIFVGGERISSPRVDEKISGGKAQITGNFSQDEANKLARDLNTGAIPAPIVLTGEISLGATLGQDALKVSIWAGIIGFLALAIFMVLNYRIPGLVAVAALSIYAIIILFFIKSELPLTIALPIALIVFGTLVYKSLNSKDATGEKVMAFILSCFVLFFLMFILKTAVVLTLAGIAGIILSLGIAVDANVLIFSRIKEEIRSGRTYSSAVEEGFFRAWASIRDSNFATLIICAVLFYFGSSIIRGFAFNLAAGILVSMFTAITITKTFMKLLANTRFGKDPKYLGVDLSKQVGTHFQFVKNRNKWFTFSGILITISILAMLIFGVKLSQDFTGGTLLEIKFDKQIEKQDFVSSLSTFQDELTKEGALPNGPVKEQTTTEKIASDLKNASVTQTGNNSFLIKTKYIDSVTHDKLIQKLENKFGNLTEPKFATVGPTIGSALKQKALWAIIIASFGIVFYVAFAFRKVPKELNPWRFGITAIVAMIHDLFITTGFFVILGAIFGVEIDALFITAMLTVLGYSVNDTIVVFDRTRENAKLASRDEKIEDIVDKSLNQTLGRSLNTSITTLITLIALFIGSFFGGAESIRYFVLALIFGIAIGTYSSIFIATSGLVAWKNWSDKKAEKRLQG